MPKFTDWVSTLPAVGTLTGTEKLFVLSNGAKSLTPAALRDYMGIFADAAVPTFGDLPLSLAVAPVGSHYVVHASSGVWFVNRKEAGWYYRSGATGTATDWQRLGSFEEAMLQNFTPEEKAKLAGVPASFASVATSGQYADLTGKPSLSAVATSGAYADLSGRPSLASVATTGAYADLSGRPSLAPVATTGAYNDLSGRPTLAAVATSGDYNDLTNKPAPGGGSAFDPRNGGYIYEEFCNSFGVLTNYKAGTGAGGGASAATGTFGNIDIYTGSTATGYSIVTASALSSMCLGTAALSVKWRSRLQQLSSATETFVATVGCGDMSNATPFIDAVSFRYTDSVNGGNWQCVCRSANVETVVDSGIAASTTIAVFEVSVNAAATEATFYIDGALVGTITTNIPTGNTRGMSVSATIVKSVGTASAIFSHDFVYAKYDISR